jgi:DNA-binding NarL/FixJ family response regulator
VNPISILLVDDHQIVRQGVRAILEPDNRFQVIGEAATGAEAIRLVKLLHPQIMILDLKIPDLSGIEVCHQVIQLAPNTIVLILTAYFEKDLIFSALRAGARGYLIKDADQINLPERLMDLYSGHNVFDPRATDVLSEYAVQGEVIRDLLSNREFEVIQLISQGLTNHEIASQLNLTENTVKGYVKDIFFRLNVHNRIEAVSVARKSGIL